MNPRSRRVALYTLAVIAILASANALAHSYAGLYGWAVHHRLSGWQAKSWPAEIDVFLAVGELALYVAYLDGWPGRQRVWPWLTALAGLAVSVAGNVGHIQAGPGRPVIVADRLTAAASPLAAFAGLAIGLLVLKMIRQPGSGQSAAPGTRTGLVALPGPAMGETLVESGFGEPSVLPHDGCAASGSLADDARLEAALLAEARAIYRSAAVSGERLSQRALARQLRGRGYRFPNEHLQVIAVSIGLSARGAA